MEHETADPWAPWRSRIEAARKRRDDKIGDWQENGRRRKGDEMQTAPISTLDTATRLVSVNKDAPLTKAKIAQLYSQTPEVRLSPRYDALQAAVPAFGRELNDTIGDASVGTTIEEVLADVVNAAGIGAALVSCDRKTEPRDVPAVDPAM